MTPREQAEHLIKIAHAANLLSDLFRHQPDITAEELAYMAAVIMAYTARVAEIPVTEVLETTRRLTLMIFDASPEMNI